MDLKKLSHQVWWHNPSTEEVETKLSRVQYQPGIFEILFQEEKKEENMN
jgi:hypothetical protein